MFNIFRISLYWGSLYRGLSTSVVGIDQRRVLVRNYILNPFFYRSYDWNYNLNRHLKYECGKENAFQCAKCGRKFPHKQNCVYHLKRKHKIVCDTIDQYMAQGLVVFRGGQGAGGQQVANPEWMKILLFPGFFPNIFPDFFRILTIIILSCQNMNKQKICHKFFPVKKPQKTKTILLLCYITYLPIANCSKKLDEERRKRSLFWFFRDAEESNILICNIHLVWLHSAS